MKKAIVCIVLLLACVLLPSFAFTEDAATVRLARTIYALAGDESYETKLAIGSVAGNRVDNIWFENDLESVLDEQHQFPCGRRYDAESLKAAHEIVSGARTLPEDVLYYQAIDASDRWSGEFLYKIIGNYGFYTESGN